VSPRHNVQLVLLQVTYRAYTVNYYCITARVTVITTAPFTNTSRICTDVIIYAFFCTKPLQASKLLYILGKSEGLRLKLVPFIHWKNIIAESLMEKTNLSLISYVNFIYQCMIK
jgi:hypothetical protein